MIPLAMNGVHSWAFASDSFIEPYLGENSPKPFMYGPYWDEGVMARGSIPLGEDEETTFNYVLYVINGFDRSGLNREMAHRTVAHVAATARQAVGVIAELLQVVAPRFPPKRRRNLSSCDLDGLDVDSFFPQRVHLFSGSRATGGDRDVRFPSSVVGHVEIRFATVAVPLSK